MHPSPGKRNFDKDLEAINGSRFRQIVKSERSFWLVVSDLLQRVKYQLRIKHLFDFHFWWVLITLCAVVVVCSIYRFNPLLPSAGEESTTAIVTAEKKRQAEQFERSATVAGIWASLISFLYAAHQDRVYRKLERSSDYIKAWQTLDMVSHRKAVRSFLDALQNKHGVITFDAGRFNQAENTFADYKSSPNRIAVLADMQTEAMEKLYQEKYRHVKEALEEVLGFMESLGQDVKMDVVDPDYLKDYFYYIVLDNYEFFRKYIESVQFISGSKVVWCNTVYLAHRWEKEKVPPNLPAICQRPLVLTQDDLVRVQHLKPDAF